MAGYLDTTAFEVRYLLGELSEEEEKKFENRYFADDRAFEELQIAEGEVIDAYVNEKLPAQARKRLEQYLEKSPRLRDRVAFARTFAGAIPDIRLEELSLAPSEIPSPYADSLVTPAPVLPLPWWKRIFKVSLAWQPAWTMALASCCILVLLGGAGVVVQSVRLRRATQQLASEKAAIEREREALTRLSAEQNTRIEASASELEAQQRRIAEARAQLEELQKRMQQLERDGPDHQRIGSPTMATLILYAGSIRSGGAPIEVKIPPGSSQLPLGIVLETADYRGYGIVIRDAQKKEIFSKKGLRLDLHKTLFLKVPTNQLRPGTYHVEVSGLASSGVAERLRTYQFRVISD